MATATTASGGRRQSPRELYAWFEKFLAEESSVLVQRHQLMLEMLAASMVNGECKEPPLVDTEAMHKNIDIEDIHFQPKTSSLGECPSAKRAPPTLEPNRPHSRLVSTKPDWDVDDSLASPAIGKSEVRDPENKKKSSLHQTLDKPETDDEPCWYPTRIVKSTEFELFFASLIILSSVIMAVESQYHGIEMGFKLGYKSFDSPAQDAWPGAVLAFEIVEFIFGVLFFVEVILKIAGQRIWFLCHAWNYFDACLVIFWLVDMLMKNMPVDGSLLRLVRLARLLRLLRLARAVQGFDSLVVMTTALQGSVSALFWVAILLFIVQMMFALFLNQILMYFMIDHSQELKDRQAVFEYFGTFSRSMLTMFELTLGNWVPCARMLQDNVSGFFVIFSLFHKISIGFACIGVINGVFMQETLKVAQSDDVMLMRVAETKNQMHARKMVEFVKYSDSTGDGKVSLDEWKESLQNAHVHNWFAGQGLSLRDASKVFDMLETDGDGKLSVDEFVFGVERLQGPARSLDLALLSEQIYERTEGQVQKTLECMLGQTHALQSRIGEIEGLLSNCGFQCEHSLRNAGAAEQSNACDGQRGKCSTSTAESPRPSEANAGVAELSNPCDSQRGKTAESLRPSEANAGVAEQPNSRDGQQGKCSISTAESPRPSEAAACHYMFPFHSCTHHAIVDE